MNKRPFGEDQQILCDIHSAHVKMIINLTQVESPHPFFNASDGRTSGRVSGRYHRLKIFSLMKSPWYARNRAFAVHLRQLSVSLYSTRFVSFSRGP